MILSEGAKWHKDSPKDGSSNRSLVDIPRSSGCLNCPQSKLLSNHDKVNKFHMSGAMWHPSQQNRLSLVSIRQGQNP